MTLTTVFSGKLFSASNKTGPNVLYEATPDIKLKAQSSDVKTERSKF